MRAWVVREPGPIDSAPLQLVQRPVPEPGPGQVRIRVAVCGVCRTDLHLAEGDLAPHVDAAVPGHEVVGYVDKAGSGSTRFAVGERVGAAWLASSCGVCRFCQRDDENLCLEPHFTGWDVDGGFAEFMVADQRFIYSLPARFDDEAVAPLLCAGIIGYRSLRRTELRRGGQLGLWGFGGSAHLTAQVAMAEGASVHVITRSHSDQQLARALGASSVGGASERPPVPLDGAIIFAPVGTLVPDALASLDRGGTLAIAGIHLTDIPALNYQEHLFEERTLRSVTANTRVDGEEFLRIASRIAIRPTVTMYDFDEVNQALSDLANDRFSGAAAIRVSAGPRPSGPIRRCASSPNDVGE
jgi:propanol-preferring alcohol dehydrogenase